MTVNLAAAPIVAVALKSAALAALAVLLILVLLPAALVAAGS